LDRIQHAFLYNTEKNFNEMREKMPNLDVFFGGGPTILIEQYIKNTAVIVSSGNLAKIKGSKERIRINHIFKILKEIDSKNLKL
jgi:hypothetical protein